MIFDTHAHYDDARFDEDREILLSSLPGKGVSCVVNPGCDAESSKKALDIAHAHPFVYAAVGWHPEEISTWTDNSLALLRSLAEDEKCVAIGEIGLDYYWDKEHKREQIAIFEAQLQLAVDMELPVIVHDREAHEDSLNTVSLFPGISGVFHCYSGSAEMASILLKDGWYLGFDGPITYKNNRKASEVLAVTPLDRILIETDSPYLPPVPFRGKRNDSSLLPYVVEKIAELKKIPAEDVLSATWENAKRFYHIP